MGIKLGKDGEKEITFREAAELIWAEERLGVGTLIDTHTGLRCTLGVLQNHTFEQGTLHYDYDYDNLSFTGKTPKSKIKVGYYSDHHTIYRENDSYRVLDFKYFVWPYLRKPTPEELCKHMYKWFMKYSRKNKEA